MNQVAKNIQVALMFQSEFNGDFTPIVSYFKKFDGAIEVQDLSSIIPKDVQAEIPRLTLTSNTDRVVITISKSRIDIHFNEGNINQEYLSRVTQLIENELKTLIFRIGYVEKVLFTGINQEEMREKFDITEKISANPGDVLEANRRINLRGSLTYNRKSYIYNNITTITLGTQNDNLVFQRERDVNTRKEDGNLGFGASAELLEFIALLKIKAEEIIF